MFTGWGEYWVSVNYKSVIIRVSTIFIILVRLGNGKMIKSWSCLKIKD